MVRNRKRNKKYSDRNEPPISEAKEPETVKEIGSLREGWLLFKDSLVVISKKPVFLIPVFISWLVVAALAIFMRFYYAPPPSFTLILLHVYLLLFAMTFVICVANLAMLELMQQIEKGENTSLGKAFKETFKLDVLKVIPIAAVWALLWFVIVIIKAITSRRRGSKKNREMSAREVARTLGGADSQFSWLGFGLDMLEKFIRMSVFLSLPAIAWENKGPISAVKKAAEIIKKHPVQFLTAYSLTFAAAILMALPLVPIFMLDQLNFEFSDFVWGLVIIYEGIIWTIGIYLEQMSVALLYMWHLKWVKKGRRGSLSSVPKPDLLDDVYELRDY